MIGWDDYRVLLAIARAEGLSGAAERLGVTLSTVFRRLERIEDALGTPAFERLRKGYVPTEAGSALVRAAERMEQEALAGDRAVTGQSTRLTGSLRVTATESLATFFLARQLPAFREKHPGLVVEIISDNRRLSLVDREADVAIRPRRPTEDGLVGRRCGSILWGIYASPGACRKLGKVGAPADLAGRAFTGWDGSPAAAEAMAWLENAVPDVVIASRSTSLLTNAATAAAGPALAALPCHLGDDWPGLRPVLSPLPGVAGELWLVTHEDLRRNARVRAFIDHLTSGTGAAGAAPA